MIDRLLIVGTGSIGQRHLRLARQILPDADIRVMHQRGGNDVPAQANGCFSVLDDALAFHPQAAIIAGPATFHAETALPLANAGVHLLVEKPLDTDPERAAKLVAASGRTNSVLAVGYNLRHLPSLQSFRQAILNGRAGRVLSVRAEVGQYLPSWRTATDYRSTVSALRHLGGGVLLELSHEIDYLRWIFGEVKWVKATASKQSRLEIDVEDCAHLVLSFSPASDGTSPVARVDLDFIRQDSIRQCTAIGENGTLRWNALPGTVEYFAAGATDWELLDRLPVQRDDSYIAEWQNFLAAIAGREKPLVGGEDALRTLRVVEAARKDAKRFGEIVQ